MTVNTLHHCEKVVMACFKPAFMEFSNSLFCDVGLGAYQARLKILFDQQPAHSKKQKLQQW
jgi:hypothetical protein